MSSRGGDLRAALVANCGTKTSKYGSQEGFKYSLSQQQQQLSGATVTACSGETDSLVGMSFHNIVYGVGVGSCLKGRKRKVILQDVSGVLLQGLNAIMGPTGSGKTSLLDILAGRKNPSGISGTVLVNGARQPKNFKCVSGYVVQDDIVMGTLSVRENLHFSAALRLPSNTTWKQRNDRVEWVIRELGLQKCANTKIGTEFFRGVSGGERKRTNIGMELIIEPQVLFLDEPTTGLDANTAVSVIKLLKDLCRRHNSIIIMSIHQPRYSIFKLFDSLTLLSLGNMVYHGQASHALQYFNEIGFLCEEHDNPADFFLDVIIHCESLPSTDGDKAEESYYMKDEGSVDLVLSYKNSLAFQENQKMLDAITDTCALNKGEAASYPSYATNIFWQLLVVCYRSMLNLIRNPMTSIFQIMTMIIFALLVGILYLRMDRREFNRETVISDRIGALFFVILNTVFGNLSAVDVFIKQKAIFIHENVSGYYRVSAFFFAKVFTDMLPMRLIPLVFFSVIAYFMIGFQLSVAKFFIFLLTIFMASQVSSSLAFAIGARIPVTGVANLLIAMVYVMSMLFGGFLVSLSSLPPWLQWLKYLSLFRYGIEALVINEIAGQCYFDSRNVTGELWTTYPCSDYISVTNLTKCVVPDCVNGTDVLTLQGYETSGDWLWFDQVGLAGLVLIFLTLTYINLRTVKKLK